MEPTIIPDSSSESDSSQEIKFVQEMFLRRVYPNLPAPPHRIRIVYPIGYDFYRAQTTIVVPVNEPHALMPPCPGRCKPLNRGYNAAIAAFQTLVRDQNGGNLNRHLGRVPKCGISDLWLPPVDAAVLYFWVTINNGEAATNFARNETLYGVWNLCQVGQRCYCECPQQFEKGRMCFHLLTVFRTVGFVVDNDPVFRTPSLTREQLPEFRRLYHEYRASAVQRRL